MRTYTRQLKKYTPDTEVKILKLYRSDNPGTDKYIRWTSLYIWCSHHTYTLHRGQACRSSSSRTYTEGIPWLVWWLGGWVVGWLGGWLVGLRVFDMVVKWLGGWLVGLRVFGMKVKWLGGWLVGLRVFGMVVGWLGGWLGCWLWVGWFVN